MPKKTKPKKQQLLSGKKKDEESQRAKLLELNEENAERARLDLAKEVREGADAEVRAKLGAMNHFLGEQLGGPKR